MRMFEAVDGLPQAVLVDVHKEPLRNKRLPEPVGIVPATDLTHFQLHWEENPEGVPKSQFFPNPYFRDAEELVGLLNGVLPNQIAPDELNMWHAFTVQFVEDIGVIAYDEIREEDTVSQETYYQGTGKETEMNIVVRDTLPPTNLLTYHAHPVYERLSPPVVQLTTAYPGGRIPPAVTRARIDRARDKPEYEPELQSDAEYWKTHAAIRLAK